MKLWEKLYRYLKGHEKWIEIKLPSYLRNHKEDNILDDKERLDDEDRVLQDLEKEEE